MRNSFSRLFFVLCVIVCNLLSAASLFAVPAYRGWQTKSQPDGTAITVRLIGDEFFHYWETEDGKIAVENEDGTFVVSDEAKPTDEQFMTKRKSSPKYQSHPRKAGAAVKPARVLFILVSYSDLAFKATSATYYKSKLGDATEGAMSMYNYLKEQSNGKYAPPIDVFGPYTLNNTYAYYGENDSDDDDLRPAQMIVDACNAANNDVDFSQYDANNDGIVDNVYVLYAGKGEADGGAPNTIWPHQWDIYGARLTLQLDGKNIRSYACSAELNGSGKCAMGTPLHEYGHVIGLPDYYDTEYKSTNYTESRTPGEWSVMDQGAYNNDGNTPPNYSIFDKYFLGWATPKFLAKDAKKNVTLTNSYGDAYQITGGTSGPVADTNTGTVYYIENRQKTGWDAYLPEHGMIVWQVKYNKTNWDNNDLNNTGGSPRYTVYSASGNPKNIGKSSDPFPGTDNVTSWTPATGCALTEITESGGNITFKYNGGETKTEWDYSLLGENCTVPADGTVALNGTLNLTITPDEGYSLADAACWTVEMGDAELTYGTDFTYNPSTNKFTITSVTGDVTILAEAAHFITWVANGVTYTTNVAAGGKITLPATNPSDCSGDGGKKFVGWCTDSSYSNATTAPTFAKTGDTYSVSTYYAVYATASAGGGGGTSEVASVTFSNASSDGSADKSSAISDLVSSDSGIKSYSGTKVYAGTTGAKIGSNSNAGSITLTLSSAAKVKTVKVTAKKYGSDTGKLSVTAGSTEIGSAQTPPASVGELTFTATDAIEDVTTITVATSNKRAYVSSIVVIAEGGSSTSYTDYSTTCSTCTLSSISLNTDAVTKTFTQGDDFSSEGLVVTARYSDCSDRTVSPTSVSAPDMSSTGQKTVTVSYTENIVTKTATYTQLIPLPSILYLYTPSVSLTTVHRLA